MSETYEFVITSTGLKRRRIIEDDIDMNQAVVDQISAGVARRSVHVMPMKFIDPDNGYNASMVALPGNQTVWSLPLVKIPLKTFYQSKDGTVFPAFDDTSSPELGLEWKVPIHQGMLVVLAVMLDKNMACLNQYLVAFDIDNRIYQLPLSNLYEDLRLCSGTYKAKPTNQVQALELAIQQFRSGSWNKDLYGGDAEKRKRTRSLFSFKVEEKGFSQIDYEDDWRKLCDKRASEFVTNNIINPSQI